MHEKTKELQDKLAKNLDTFFKGKKVGEAKDAPMLSTTFPSVNKTQKSNGAFMVPYYLGSLK